MDPFNAMRENEKGLLKLMLLQPPTVPEDTCGEATIRIKLNMPNLASPGVWHRFDVFGLRWKYWWRWCWLIFFMILGRTVEPWWDSPSAMQFTSDGYWFSCPWGMVLTWVRKDGWTHVWEDELNWGILKWIETIYNDLNPTMGLKKQVIGIKYFKYIIYVHPLYIYYACI